MDAYYERWTPQPAALRPMSAASATPSTEQMPAHPRAWKLRCGSICRRVSRPPEIWAMRTASSCRTAPSPATSQVRRYPDRRRSPRPLCYCNNVQSSHRECCKLTSSLSLQLYWRVAPTVLYGRDHHTQHYELSCWSTCLPTGWRISCMGIKSDDWTFSLSVNNLAGQGGVARTRSRKSIFRVQAFTCYIVNQPRTHGLDLSAAVRGTEGLGEAGVEVKRVAGMRPVPACLSAVQKPAAAGATYHLEKLIPGPRSR